MRRERESFTQMGRMCEPTDGIPQTPIYTFLNFDLEILDLEILSRTQF